MLKKITHNSQICIIASDPGGAEPLYRICKEINCKKFFFLSGSAKKIFKNIKSNKNSELNKSILKSDLVLCSSSFNELSYYNAIQFAKCNNIHTTLVLDHWTFFKDRLKKNRNDKANNYSETPYFARSQCLNGLLSLVRCTDFCDRIEEY